MVNGPDRWRQRLRVRRHVGTVGMVAVLVGGVAAAVAITGSGHHGQRARSHAGGKRDAALLSALSSTDGSGSFDFTYATSDVSGAQTFTFDGHGVVDTSPYATMAISDAASSYGAVTLVVNDNDAWEFGAGDFGVDPGSNSGPGMPLSQFAQEVEESVGSGVGALDMMGLADPAGRLDLAANMITSANEVGVGSVDGMVVTTYAVTINVENAVNQPGLSPEQHATVVQALTYLQQQGYEGTSELVSIDAAGYIREIKSTVSFSSGASVVADETYSDFGCAGTVTPGSPLLGATPAGCVSPDQPTASATAPTPPPTTTPPTTTPPTTTHPPRRKAVEPAVAVDHSVDYRTGSAEMASGFLRGVE
jgi:hypothetical protein